MCDPGGWRGKASVSGIYEVRDGSVAGAAIALTSSAKLSAPPRTPLLSHAPLHRSCRRALELGYCTRYESKVAGNVKSEDERLSARRGWAIQELGGRQAIWEPESAVKPVRQEVTSSPRHFKAPVASATQRHLQPSCMSLATIAACGMMF